MSPRLFLTLLSANGRRSILSLLFVIFFLFAPAVLLHSAAFSRTVWSRGCRANTAEFAWSARGLSNSRAGKRLDALCGLLDVKLVMPSTENVMTDLIIHLPSVVFTDSY